MPDHAETVLLLQRALDALRSCVHQDKGWATRAHEVAREIEARLKAPAIDDGEEDA